MMAALLQQGFDSFLLAKRLVGTDKLNLDTGLFGQRFGMIANFTAQRIGLLGIIKQPYLVVAKITRHGASVTDIR